MTQVHTVESGETLYTLINGDDDTESVVKPPNIAALFAPTADEAALEPRRRVCQDMDSAAQEELRARS